MKDGFIDLVAPEVYWDKHFGQEAAKILPGEYFATTRDMVLVTVLGSCVAACIRDRRSGVGGMNHFMLPDAKEMDNGVGLPTRYGVHAMEMLINKVLKLGAQRSQLEAKVFGAGRVLSGFTVNNVGEKNAKFVLDYLETERISIVAQDLLDIYPRKVYFFPRTGRVLVKKLKSVHNNTIVEREQSYVQNLRQAPIEGDIELFGD